MVVASLAPLQSSSALESLASSMAAASASAACASGTAAAALTTMEVALLAPPSRSRRGVAAKLVRLRAGCTSILSGLLQVFNQPCARDRYNGWALI
eukprot:3236345-Rhodomonas_salina.1